MAVKVQWDSDGPFAICDTPAEAMELLQHARAASNGAKRPQTEGTRSPTEDKAKTPEDKVDAFLSCANDKGKKLLKTLLEHRSGIEGDQLSSILGIDSSGLGGITGSLSKCANKAKLNLGLILISEMRFEGSRRYRWMAPGKLLLEHAEKV